MDNLTSAQRRKNMQNIRSANTRAELFVARELRKQGVYFARNVKTIIGKPDFIFRKIKLAVFIDSDFWHGHTKRFVIPKTNRNYWMEKIEQNRARDKKVNSVLKKEGWEILRLWEYDIKNNSENSIEKIIKIIRKTSK